MPEPNQNILTEEEEKKTWIGSLSNDKKNDI